MSDDILEQVLDEALKRFFSKSTVPYENWTPEMKKSYRQDMLSAYDFLNSIGRNK
jgi:hypothetical protein